MVLRLSCLGAPQTGGITPSGWGLALSLDQLPRKFQCAANVGATGPRTLSWDNSPSGRGPGAPLPLLPTSALSMPIPHTERRPDIWGTPPPVGRGGLPVPGRHAQWKAVSTLPLPAAPPAPLFLGPLLSIVGCISFPTPSPEKQLGFLQAKPSRLPQSWCVGACTLPNRHDISELSSKWISRLRHVSKGSGGGAG